METLRLTEHFRLGEFIKSETAECLGIDNRVPSQFVPRLENLCRQVLEPLRQWAGEPVEIASGYRCPELNRRVGGVPSSQHTLGMAADIRLPLTDATWADGKRHTDMKKAREWMEFIIGNTDFDQLIMETANRKDFWLHVSCQPDIKKNRHKVVRFMLKSRPTPAL